MKDEDQRNSELPSLSELDRRLRDELRGRTLVGEIDLELWGPLAETVLDRRSGALEPAELQRRAPAVLVAYLCWQGRHNYNEGTFWPNVSIEGLRTGAESGPAFLAALRILDLPTFDDLEKLEGIGPTGRYVRRVHLHGGLPRSSVRHVLDLLAATLRASAADAEEVIDTWITSNLASYGLDKPSERLVLYTGDFGLGIIAGFIELLRSHGRRDIDSAELQLAPYLVEAFNEWLPTHDPARFTWVFVAGPRVEVDRFGSRGPMVRVPRGDTNWFANEQVLGSSSRRGEEVFVLEPASEWLIGQKEQRRVRFQSLAEVTGVWVFDERGRVHRGGTLYGSTAYLVSSGPITVAGEVDRRPLAGQWKGYDLITVDLRGRSELQVELTSGFIIDPVPVDSSWSMRLSGDLLGGLTGDDGEPVLGDTVCLRPDAGYFPDPAMVTVEIRTGDEPVKQQLDRFPSDGGQFDLTGSFIDRDSVRAEIRVQVPGGDEQILPILRLPGMQVALPLLAAPDEAVDVPITAHPGIECPDSVSIPPGEALCTIDCRTIGGQSFILRARVERCRWEIRNAEALVPDFGGERFVVRPDEMRGGVLEILCDDTSNFRLWLQDRSGRRLQRLRFRRRHHEATSVEVRLDSVLETVTNSSAALFDLVLWSGDGRSVTLGQVQTEPSAEHLTVKVKELKKRTRLKVTWGEPRPWPNRVVRLWEREGDQPVAAESVPDAECELEFKITRTAGAHLLELGAASTEWTKPRRPTPGPSCVTLFLGRHAQEVIDAVRAGDLHAVFSDEEVVDMAALLGELWVKGLDGVPLTEMQQKVVISLTFDEPDRLLAVLDLVTAATVPDPDNPVLSTRRRMELLRLAFDLPVRSASERQAEALAALWEDDPLIASCLDTDLSSDRWKEHTSWSWNEDEGVTAGLDALVAPMVSAVKPDWREINAMGVNYVPDPLSPHHWSILTGRLPSGATEPLASWVKDWPTDPTAPRGRVWSGLMARLRVLGSIAYAAHPIRALIGAACTMLDPTTPPESVALCQAVLVVAMEELPALTEACILVGVSAMRTLEHAPGWNRRNS